MEICIFKLNIVRARVGKLFEEPISDYYRLMDQIVSVTSIQLYSCNTKAAIDNT